MNTRIRKRFSTAAGLVIEGVYQTNFYQIDVSMVTVSEDPVIQNVAYDRVCYWIDEVFTDSVLIQQSDPTLSAHESTGRKILTFEQEPVDGVVGLVLFQKLNAIVQDNIHITDLDISSVLGQEVIYQHNDQEIVEEFNMPNWCHDPGPGWNHQHSTGNVVNLDRVADWKKLGLQWKRPSKNTANTIMLNTAFPKHEDK